MSHREVVLDSNVLISAVLFGGVPDQILRMIIAGNLRCSISLAILDEVRDVLQRPKIGLTAHQALAILEELQKLCKVVTPGETVRAVLADPDDDRVLECALAAQAEVIITGDSHLLDLGEYRGISIESPSDFLAHLETRQSPDGS